VHLKQIKTERASQKKKIQRGIGAGAKRPYSVKSYRLPKGKTRKAVGGAIFLQKIGKAGKKKSLWVRKDKAEKKIRSL